MQRIHELPLDYIYNADFDVAANADAFTGPTPAAPAARKTRPPAELPGYLASLYEVPLLTAEQEVHLFRKLNFLKHTAATLREKLSAGGFSGEKNPVMDRIESLYEAAVATKNLIVQSNLRLVVSIAKRHIKSSDDFFTLVSDGNMSLIKAVEKFDYARGNKFSTYATWSIVKNFARSIPNEYKHQDRFRTTTDELFVARQDNRIDPYLQETVQKQRQRELARILDSLDEREQKIITARFGLRRGDEPLTLKEVGAEIGVTQRACPSARNAGVGQTPRRGGGGPFGRRTGGGLIGPDRNGTDATYGTTSRWALAWAVQNLGLTGYEGTGPR